ncbi:MAG: hypothetical protein J2P54_22375, partial [Bradyrhizobiaceae bacterium]|nr:hypothetical protein [Bradyrhizobiaceae bacterium]
CVPLWYVIAIFPACVLTFGIQGLSWFSHSELRPSFLLFSAFQVPALLICWWWDRRGTWT